MANYHNNLFEPLWEAWVDDESSEQLVLYVVGEVYRDKNGREPQLLPIPRISTSTELQLELSPGNAEESGVLSEVIYSQPLLRKHQYQTISIYSGGYLLVKWRRIESMQSVMASGGDQ